jgi:hypothetical protein
VCLYVLLWNAGDIGALLRTSINFFLFPVTPLSVTKKKAALQGTTVFQHHYIPTIPLLRPFHRSQTNRKITN